MMHDPERRTLPELVKGSLSRMLVMNGRWEWGKGGGGLFTLMIMMMMITKLRDHHPAKMSSVNHRKCLESSRHIIISKPSLWIKLCLRRHCFDLSWTQTRAYTHNPRLNWAHILTPRHLESTGCAAKRVTSVRIKKGDPRRVPFTALTSFRPSYVGGSHSGTVTSWRRIPDWSCRLHAAMDVNIAHPRASWSRWCII